MHKDSAIGNPFLRQAQRFLVPLTPHHGLIKIGSDTGPPFGRNYHGPGSFRRDSAGRGQVVAVWRPEAEKDLLRARWRAVWLARSNRLSIGTTSVKSSWRSQPKIANCSIVVTAQAWPS